MTRPVPLSARLACVGALAALATCGSVARSKDLDLAMHRPAAPAALPEISGPGHVLRAGNLFMKIPNNGLLGNAFPNLSSDPSGQWPAASGVEYLNVIQLGVGAVDPSAPAASRHRFSYAREWAPGSLDPVDRIYSTQAGAVNGARYVNEDGDLLLGAYGRFDEDFLDGRDNDGDGLIDEDFGALGSEMFTCVMRDDGPLSVPGNEPHVPLGLECRLSAWAYSQPGLRDFNPIELSIFNRSGHELDSVYVVFSVDMDCGPLNVSNYFADDRSLGGYPSGEFTRTLVSGDPQRQFPHPPLGFAGVSADSALCPRTKVRVNGFSLSDDNGDSGLTPGVASFLLLDHTIDGTGLTAPTRVGFRSFRTFPAGTVWASGGNPTTDSLRWVFMSSNEGVDPVSGFIDVGPSAVNGDQRAWCSVGPFLHVPADGSVSVTVAFAVEPGTFQEASAFAGDYAAYQTGTMSGGALQAAHPAMANAFAAQMLHDGTYAPQPGAPVPDFSGRETPVIAPAGQVISLQGCDNVDASPRYVNDAEYSFFDFDCDFCTGVWDETNHRGLAHQPWTSGSPTLSVPPVTAGRAAGMMVSPNPALGPARIRYSLASREELDVAVYDPAGRRIRGLFTGAAEAGEHELAWDGADGNGRAVPAGLYLIRMKTADHVSAVRAVRVK